MRRSIFKAARLIHVVIDRLLTRVFGLRVRQHYIRLGYRIKTRLFPEYGSHIPDRSEIGSLRQNEVWLPPAIPEWVLAEMRDIGREIDPVLYPTDVFVAQCQFYTFPVITRPGNLYKRLIASCTSDRYTHCFAIPWLKRGGADFVSLCHIEFAAKQPGSKVLVVLTEPGDSPWLDRIPDGVDVIDASKAVSEISHNELLQVLARVFVQIDIKVLHIINSRHVWEVVCKYGLAITQKTRIFASIYCDDIDGFGQPVGFGRMYLGQCYKHLQAVFSDNSAYPALLSRTYGYQSSLFVILRSPINLPVIKFPERKPLGRRVLWAGRLDRQKRPDLLLEIAQLMPDVEFHVFGDAVLESSHSVVASLGKTRNVKMMGAFDGAETLPFSEFPVFLYTSQWDGTPTIVLAAAYAGIPIVASAVGGVGDVVRASSGYPVPNVESVSDYVRHIYSVLDDPRDAQERALRAREYVLIHHSLHAFEAVLKATAGYVDSVSLLSRSEVYA